MMWDGCFVTRAECDVASAVVGDDTILLNLRSGVYFSLKGVGARTWGLIGTGVNVEDLVAGIIAEYDVDADTCKQDLNILLTEMNTAGLVRIEKLRSS